MALTLREKERVVDQIARIIDQLYVHRRMKTALYGVDALSLLRALRRRAGELDDVSFNRGMRAAIAQLRDRHVRYDFSGAGPNYLAPFQVERAFDAGDAVYLVTSSNSADIPVGSVVRRWNGVPLGFVIRELAEDIGAENDAARNALALFFLGWRPASFFDPPVEQEIRLSLVLPDGAPQDVTVAWSPQPPQPPEATVAELLPVDGIDTELYETNLKLFSTFSPDFEEVMARRYSNVSAGRIAHDGVEFGYLRIRDFQVDDAEDFATYVADLLKTLPPNGLVIDLRANPGGYIRAGELLLQLLTDQPIRPHGFRFRSSDAVNFMIGTSDNYAVWGPTVAQGTRLGAEHSGMFPIEGDEESFNQIGRVYPGPSVLIVNALTFSTGDMVTAGYKDHAIGPVICTDENIAAGGANNWPYDVLRASFPGFLLPAAVEAELDQGVLSAAVRSAFEMQGRPLDAGATVAAAGEDRLGRLWAVTSNANRYVVGKRTWLRRDLAVYWDDDNPLVGDIPPGVTFGFSVRQAVRRKLSDGLVLEDEGIEADHYYQMTRKDVLAGNADLIAFACSLLRS